MASLFLDAGALFAPAFGADAAGLGLVAAGIVFGEANVPRLLANGAMVWNDKAWMCARNLSANGTLYAIDKPIEYVPLMQGVFPRAGHDVRLTGESIVLELRPDDIDAFIGTPATSAMDQTIQDAFRDVHIRSFKEQMGDIFSLSMRALYEHLFTLGAEFDRRPAPFTDGLMDDMEAAGLLTRRARLALGGSTAHTHNQLVTELESQAARTAFALSGLTAAAVSSAGIGAVLLLANVPGGVLLLKMWSVMCTTGTMFAASYGVPPAVLELMSIPILQSYMDDWVHSAHGLSTNRLLELAADFKNDLETKPGSRANEILFMRQYLSDLQGQRNDALAFERDLYNQARTEGHRVLLDKVGIRDSAVDFSHAIAIPTRSLRDLQHELDMYKGVDLLQQLAMYEINVRKRPERDDANSIAAPPVVQNTDGATSIPTPPTAADGASQLHNEAWPQSRRDASTAWVVTPERLEAYLQSRQPHTQSAHNESPAIVDPVTIANSALSGTGHAARMTAWMTVDLTALAAREALAVSQWFNLCMSAFHTMTRRMDRNDPEASARAVVKFLDVCTYEAPASALGIDQYKDADNTFFTHRLKVATGSLFKLLTVLIIYQFLKKSTQAARNLFFSSVQATTTVLYRSRQSIDNAALAAKLNAAHAERLEREAEREAIAVQPPQPRRPRTSRSRSATKPAEPKRANTAHSPPPPAPRLAPATSSPHDAPPLPAPARTNQLHWLMPLVYAMVHA